MSSFEISYRFSATVKTSLLSRCNADIVIQVFKIYLNSYYSSISLFQVQTISLQLQTHIPPDHSLGLMPEQEFCLVDYLSCGFFEVLGLFQYRFFVSHPFLPSKYSLQVLHSFFPMYHFSLYFIHCLVLISDWQACPCCPVYHLEIALEILHSSILTELHLFS